jgi:hypothetical protein
MPTAISESNRSAGHSEKDPVVLIDVAGLIPGDNGADTSLWDAGSYVNLTRGDEGEEVPIASALGQGRAYVWFEGRKIRGGYVLMDASQQGKGPTWLMIKKKDESAAALRTDAGTGNYSASLGLNRGAI